MDWGLGIGETRLGMRDEGLGKGSGLARERSSSSSSLLSSLELSDSKVYQLYVRALLGIAAYFFKSSCCWHSLIGV